MSTIEDGDDNEYDSNGENGNDDNGVPLLEDDELSLSKDDICTLVETLSSATFEQEKVIIDGAGGVGSCSSTSTRTHFIQDTLSQLVSHRKSRVQLAQGLGLRVALSCTSPTSFHRIATLLVRSFIVQCREQAAAAATKDDEMTIVKGLAEALCIVMIRFEEMQCQTGSDAFVSCRSSRPVAGNRVKYKKYLELSPREMVVRELTKELSLSVPLKSSKKAEEEKEEDLNDVKTQEAALTVAIKTFYDIVQSSSTSTTKQHAQTLMDGAYAPALSCLHCLVTKNCSKDSLEVILKNIADSGSNAFPTTADTFRLELITTMVQHLTGSSSSGSSSKLFASPAEIQCMSWFLCSVSSDEWNTIVLPPMAQKFRAKPDSAVEMVACALSVLAKNISKDDPCSSTSPKWFPMEDQLLEGALLLPSAIRQLLSTNNTSSYHGHEILISLIRIAPMDHTMDVIGKALADCLSSTTTASGPSTSVATATTPDQREVVYRVLSDIAYFILGSSTSSNKAAADLTDLSSTVLRSLSTAVAKEASSSTATHGGKRVGCHAMASWLAVYSRFSKKEGSSGDDDGGVKAAISFLQASMTGPTATISKEFRSRVGTVLLSDVWSFVSDDSTSSNSTTTTSWLVSMLVQPSKEKVIKGLEGIVETASKKHASGSSALSFPLDGLLAVYLLMQLSKAEDAKGTASKLLSKLLESKGSFLLASNLIEHPCDEEVLQVLPMVMEHIIMTSSSKQKQTNEACRTLAGCIMYPWNGTMVRRNALQSLKHIIDLSDKTEAIKIAKTMLNQLMLLTNERSLKLTQDGQDVMTSRKDYNSTESDSPIKQLYEHDFNAKGIRDATTLLLDTILRNSASGTDEDHHDTLVAKAMLLRHVGCTTSIDPMKSQRLGLITYTTNVLNQRLNHHKRSTITSSLAKTFANVIYPPACCATTSSTSSSPTMVVDGEISPIVHDASISLISTLAQIAAQNVDFDSEDDDGGNEEGDNDDNETKLNQFCKQLILKELPCAISHQFYQTTLEVAKSSKTDFQLYHTPDGILFSKEDADGSSSLDATSSSTTTKTKSATTRPRGKGGKFLLEEDEWEQELKKKQQKSASASSSKSSSSLSAKEKALLEQQSTRKQEIGRLLNVELVRCSTVMEHLCSSDIMVGNQCLKELTHSILCFVLVDCEAKQQYPRTIQQKGYDLLMMLSNCIYEIDEDYAPDTTQSLLSCLTFPNKKTQKTRGAVAASSTSSSSDDDMEERIKLLKETFQSIESRSVEAFPNQFTLAGIVLEEIDMYGDALSKHSFWFVLPILRATLLGPRTPSGCDSVLRILLRHIDIIITSNNNSSMRKDIAESLLELLSHDRSQTFVDPSPYDVLKALYVGVSDEDEEDEADTSDTALPPPPSTSELSPMLGDLGALSAETNCRLASMKTLGSLVKRYPTLFSKGNALLENRIWLNCFDTTHEGVVKQAARYVWQQQSSSSTTNDNDYDDQAALAPPSKFYAAPLLSLLSYKKSSDIRSNAAEAFAAAMSLLPDTIEPSIIRLCQTYVEAFPMEPQDQVAEGGKSSKKLSTPTSSAQTKPVVVKKIVKKVVKPAPSATSSIIAGVGAGKKIVRTKVVSKKSATSLPSPKAPPVMSKAQLENQFTMAGTSSGGKKDKDIEQDSDDKIQIRLGILRAMSSIAKTKNIQLDLSSMTILSSFLLYYAIADPNEDVVYVARGVARDVIAKFGSSDDAIGFLLPLIEGLLGDGNVDDKALKSALGGGDNDKTSKSSTSTDKLPRSVAAADRRKEGAVVALGSVALHLKGDEYLDKVDAIIDMLLGALKTPSEGVQSSVAESLSKLMKKGRTQERIESIISLLMGDCLHGSTYAIRRGSAYGLAAVVKGSGIACLKKYDIVNRLEDACNSGSSNTKEGALCAIELLCERLGLLFEPYVIVLLPSLLRSFGDGSDYVRKAASNTAILIMSKLSSHGVKLVLPSILSAFNEPEWRTKQASIIMLGSMSNLAPKQLASSLPKIVPKLTEAFGDSHPKVKASAEQSLMEISKVIRNPEISELSPILVKALTDPAAETKRALESLIETEFLHAIDAPSLALIVPVLYRGLRDRSASSKRMGALIAGNMCTMISDPRDFAPYLPVLLPGLKGALLDPIPDVRKTAAKALGSLTRGLGEDVVPDLRPWLIEKIKKTDVTTVERSGAAQGLTEVLIAGGTGVAESVMKDEIFPLASHPSSSSREGALWMLAFLPSSLGLAFAPMIDDTLVIVLRGLADETEAVRDVAMRSGRALVRSHGKANVDTILPSLEDNLSNDDWHIRLASLTLMGDLLSMIGGTKVVKGDADTQEDTRQAERAHAQIALTLGSDTRKRVLSRIYLARSDTVASVRSMAIQVWKTVVSVTPRTLRDILHVLVAQIVTYLGSGNPTQTEIGGRCLGDIVAKLGDAVLPEIIPVLRDNLYRGGKHTRQGACFGLAEVISCSSKDHIIKYLTILSKAVQDALCDEDDGVRTMAADCFQSLYGTVGSRALDEVVPSLLVAMSSDGRSRDRALHGLTGVLSVRSRELLPYLLPRLLMKPITVRHANALGTIVTVTGDTIFAHFNTIVPTYISELSAFEKNTEDEDEKEREEAIRNSARSICSSVETDGVRVLVSEVAKSCSSDKAPIRRESCWMLGVIAEERKEAGDFFDLTPIFLRELLYRFNDDDKDVLLAAHQATASLTKNVPAEELVKHLEFSRNLIASMVSDARRRKGGVGDGEFLLPGLNMPKGLEPLMPMYQRGILYGDPNIREVAASGLGEIIALTSSKYLGGPFAVKMTGPLLRIVGDRNPSNVKVAIIKTLSAILDKGGPALRAFVPQFQTTFLKALSDPSRQVRVEAAKALELLMPLSTRVDPLIKELVNGALGNGTTSGTTTVDSAGAVAIQTATLEALAVVLRHGGQKAKLPDSIPSALSAGTELLIHPDEGLRESAAKVIGASCELLGAEKAEEMLEMVLDVDGDGESSNESKHGHAFLVYRILASKVGPDIPNSTVSSVGKLMASWTNDDDTLVKQAACVASGAVLGLSKETPVNVQDAIIQCMDLSHEIDLHRAVARGLCTAVRLNPAVFSGKAGLPILDSALKLATNGTQRVQFAINDFLWLALDVKGGQEGLKEYTDLAMFENSKSMKSVYQKVLIKIKNVPEDK